MYDIFQMYAHWHILQHSAQALRRKIYVVRRINKLSTVLPLDPNLTSWLSCRKIFFT